MPARGRRKKPKPKPKQQVKTDTTISLKPLGIDSKVHVKKSFILPTGREIAIGLAGLGLLGGAGYYAHRHDLVNLTESYDNLRRYYTEADLNRFIRNNIRLDL